MADLNQTNISDTGFIKGPVGTQGQRTADSAGKLRYNSDKSVFEWHNSTGWVNRGDWVITPNYRDAPSYTPHVLIQVESEGLNNTNGWRRVFVQIDGTTVLNATAPRSYRITKLRQDPNTGFWSYVSSNGYDVYGLSSEADNAKAFLEGFVDGELMILNTYDEPNRNASRFYDTLQDKFGSKIRTFESSGQLSSRDTRLIVSICGSSIPIFEEIKPSPQPGTYMSMWIP
jgi:hypothetical protein